MVELIHHEADVNHDMKDGLTPLHAATEKGFVRIVQDLVNNGADVNAVDKLKNTPLHYAVGGITSEYHDVVDFLLQRDANVNAVNGQNATPLDMVLSARSNVFINNYKKIDRQTD